MRALRTVIAGTAGILAATAIATAPADAVTRDRCLNGTWKMTAAQATAYMTAIMNATGASGGTSTTVQSSAITATFGGGNATVAAPKYSLTSSSPGGGTITGTASFSSKVPYTTSRGKIVVGNGTADFQMSDMTMTIDGNTIPIPLEPQAIQTGPSSTGYTCTSRKLVWNVPVPSGAPIKATFTRS